MLLLASIASQSGDTEYYVKPTDFTNVTCPGQPCLTINEYTNDVTYYIKSNTVLTFLPGKHALVRPIVISNVENISLAAFSNERHPKIVAQFICQEVVNTNCINGPELYVTTTADHISWKVPVCCSVIRLLNVSRVSVSGMSIEPNVQEITGITMQKSSNVHVQMNVSCTKNNHILAAMSDSDYFCHFGLLASESSHLFVDKTHAHKNLVGIGLHRTNNTIISNSKFSHSEKYGLYIYHKH